MELSAVKSMMTAKEIARRRLDINKLLKKPGKDHKCDIEKENISQIFKPKPRKLYQKPEFDIFDTKIPDHRGKNPFFVPLKQRVFHANEVKRKGKPIKIVEEELKTITTHIHDQFYKVVDGRPVRPNANIKVFMSDIRNILLYRANTAYLQDQILNIDMLLSFDELNLYNECTKMYKDTVVNFQKFLQESYDIATIAMNKTQEVELQIQVINKKFEIYNYKYGNLQSRLIVLSDRFDVLLKYRRFLDEVSPIRWRIEHGLDGQCQYFKPLFLDVETEETYMAAKSTPVVSELKCILYYTQPEEIMQLYDDIALQCRRYIEINVSHDRVMKPIIQINKYLRTKLKTEMSEMEYIIHNTEMHILWFEKKENLYRTKFFTILNEQFKELVSSRTSMKLFSCIQDVHSKILGDAADPNDTLPNLMREVELFFDRYMLLLDLMDLDIVKAVSNEILRKDREMMKNAYIAQRELKEWANFEKALKTSFKPTHLFKRKTYVPKIKKRFDLARSSLDAGVRVSSSSLFESESDWSESVASDDSRVVGVGTVPSRSGDKRKSVSRLIFKKSATNSQSKSTDVKITVAPETSKKKFTGKTKKNTRKSPKVSTSKASKGQKQK